MFKYDSKTFLPSDQRECEITNDDFKQLWEQELNEISDEENPEFMFQTMHMKLVLAIANGKINAKKAVNKLVYNTICSIVTHCNNLCIDMSNFLFDHTLYHNIYI